MNDYNGIRCDPDSEVIVTVGSTGRFAVACRDAGLAPIRPQGVYCLLADVSILGCDSDQAAAAHMLAKTGVTSVPGSSFYADPAEGRYQVSSVSRRKPATWRKRHAGCGLCEAASR